MSSTDNLMGYLKKKPGRLGPGVIVVMHFYACHDLWAASSVLGRGDHPADGILARHGRGLGCDPCVEGGEIGGAEAEDQSDGFGRGPAAASGRGFIFGHRKIPLDVISRAPYIPLIADATATNPESPERAMEKTMTSFACDYDRRSAPASRMWYYVSTPSVFCEHNLPVSDERMSRAEKLKYRELLDLSERHGAPIRASHYRIG